MDSDTDYDNIMYTLFPHLQHPYCAEKYNEINIGPYEADKSKENTPHRAPHHSCDYFNFLVKYNYIEKYKTYKNIAIHLDNTILHLLTFQTPIFNKPHNHLFLGFYYSALYLTVKNVKSIVRSFTLRWSNLTQ